jgi:hypothetical protein
VLRLCHSAERARSSSFMVMVCITWPQSCFMGISTAPSHHSVYCDKLYLGAARSSFIVGRISVLTRGWKLDSTGNRPFDQFQVQNLQRFSALISNAYQTAVERRGGLVVKLQLVKHSSREIWGQVIMEISILMHVKRTCSDHFRMPTRKV